MTTALLCSKCHKPIRKGQSVKVITFARYLGVKDGQPVSEPWLSVVVHLREECMGSLTREVIREARLAGRRAVTKPSPSPVSEAARELRDAPRDGTVDINALHHKLYAALAAEEGV